MTELLIYTNECGSGVYEIEAENPTDFAIELMKELEDQWADAIYLYKSYGKWHLEAWEVETE